LKLIPRCKVWLETEEGFILGPGGLEILEAVERRGSLKAASEELGMSYKFVWTYIRRLERSLGVRILETRRGGYRHGGSSLTPCGERLLEAYKGLLEAAEEACRKYRGMINELLVRGECRGSWESGLPDSGYRQREG